MKLQFMKILALLLFIGILIQAITGFLSFIYDLDNLHNLHFYSGIALLVIVLFHLIVNWTWIKANFTTNKGTAPPTSAK